MNTPYPNQCPNCKAQWSDPETPEPKPRPTTLGCWKCFHVFKLEADNTLTPQAADYTRQMCRAHAADGKAEMVDPKSKRW